MDAIIYRSVTLPCDRKEAFEQFTLNANLEKWLSVSADVEPKAGGKYELFWNAKDKENDSTIGCKVLAISPEKFINFEWKGAKQFKHFMNNVRPLTNVSVFFLPNRGSTEVHLIHSGWREGTDWGEARLWFDKAWETAFAELRTSITSRHKKVK
jgi:uncharacterized protein YndB with AHSA1/START domain